MTPTMPENFWTPVALEHIVETRTKLLEGWAAAGAREESAHFSAEQIDNLLLYSWRLLKFGSGCLAWAANPQERSSQIDTYRCALDDIRASEKACRNLLPADLAPRFSKLIASGVDLVEKHPAGSDARFDPDHDDVPGDAIFSGYVWAWQTMRYDVLRQA